MYKRVSFVGGGIRLKEEGQGGSPADHLLVLPGLSVLVARLFGDRERSVEQGQEDGLQRWLGEGGDDDLGPAHGWPKEAW